MNVAKQARYARQVETRLIVMTQSSPFIKLGLVTGVHLALGLVLGVVALSFPGRDWPVWISVWFLALVCSEMLLVGVWAGFATAAWWMRLLGLVAGLGWMAALSLSTATSPRIEDSLSLLGLLAPPVLVVSGACMCCRWLLAKIERRSHWELRPVAEELQFTLKSMIGLTVAISVLLGLGRLVHFIDGQRGGPVVTVFVLVLIALLSVAMLVWASLGQGRVTIRIPIVIVGMAAIGLIFPYYLGGPAWRYAAWPALTVITSGYVIGSLLVIRSCGYRLVSVRKKAVTS